MQKLSIIIPAYNEAHRIQKTLLSVSGFLQKQSFQSEILVISDGSKDETESVVNSLKNQIPNLSIIQNQENHGKGWVTRQGMLATIGDIRLFMDADNSTKIDEIAKFLPFFEQGYDVVIGSRRIQGAVIAAHQGFIRDFLGGVFRFIVHTLVPVGVADSQCGFKAFTSKSAEAIFPKQSIYRWAFDVEILALARRANFKIKEVPIIWVNDSESHVKFSGMVKMLLEIIQIRMNLWFGKYK
ncbi:MAG: dolichyl-phosphate beta-glucosyltransferase [Patescibacteria group bacterium]